MLITLIIIGIFFAWLAYETKFFSIRLEAHSDKPIIYPREDNNEPKPPKTPNPPNNYKSGTLLLLAETCSLTKFHNEFKDSRYKPRYNDYKTSYQVMKFGNQTITINAVLPELYERLKEVNNAVNGKIRQSPIKTAPLPMFITYDKSIRNWNTNQIEHTEPVYRDCLCGVEWLKAHEHDIIPEPTMELLVDGKEFHVNGNYKKGIIKEWIKKQC